VDNISKSKSFVLDEVILNKRREREMRENTLLMNYMVIKNYARQLAEPFPETDSCLSKFPPFMEP
jgi:hypothetical protein